MGPVFECFFDFPTRPVFVDEDHPQEEHPQRVDVGSATLRFTRAFDLPGGRPNVRVVVCQVAAGVTTETVVTPPPAHASSAH